MIADLMQTALKGQKFKTLQFDKNTGLRNEVILNK